MVQYHTADVKFSMPEKLNISSWISKVAAKEDAKLQHINFIFCSDEYLLNINTKFLNHDTYTDVITFDYSVQHKIVIGDIFISVERVKDNAILNNKDFIVELLLVMVHGVLHLLGYSDQSSEKAYQMRQLEERYSNLILPNLKSTTIKFNTFEKI